ncbi:hypothetical protein DFH29DRAFT_995887 [Suillus ampliporus]|nr:hypothetical protein DFH29DRAFT_995887 [Suillus ampliporus]
MLSSIPTGIYIAAQAVVEYIPVLPSMTLNTELPLSLVDGFMRATLLLSSLVIANDGFFINNMFSFIEPNPLTLTTPRRLLTSSPFWAELHGVISTVLGSAGDKVEPMDPESARALCALILAGMFSTRTAKNFGLVWKRSVAEKIKTQ